MGEGQRSWTEDEVQFLKDNYETMSQEEIGKVLGRGRGSIDKQVRKWKLKKSKIKVKIGDKFGFLTVIRIYHGRRPDGQNEIWCECECDNVEQHGEKRLVNVRNKNLGQGTQSCGCLIEQVATKRLTTHGLCAAGHKPLIGILVKMHKRCYDVKSSNYKYYGGKGVTIADEWNFNVVGREQACRNFIEWSLANGYRSGLTINRIGGGNYGPISSEWITAEDQGKDKTNNRYLSIDGEEKLLIEWMKDERVTVTIATAVKRLADNWSHKEALFTPGRKMKKKVDTIKYDEETVKLAFELKAKGMTYSQIGKELNIKAPTVTAFLNGKTRKDLYNKYKYLLEN